MARSPRLPVFLVALLAALLTASCIGSPPAPPIPGAPPPAPPGPPAGTPWSPGQFGIGVTAQPPDLGGAGWVTQSGVPFDYAYQYLAAGVNTGNGWQTWNTSAQ